MSPYVIKIMGVGSSFAYLDPQIYVGFYDPEGMDGYGLFESTPDPDQALQFDTPKAAFELWQTIPESRPVRDDGLPNKPLTALTIEVISLENAHKEV